MKKFIFLFVFFLLAIYVFAQVPQSFNYQLIARDTSGKVLVNRILSIQISILKDANNGIVVYSEWYSATTSNLGLVNIAIGTGNVVTGSFQLIEWDTHLHFIKLEIDPVGGTNYFTMGTTQLVSVPYALYADKAKIADQFNETDTMLWKKNGNDVFYKKGNVGIGTTEPTGKLDVRGSGIGNSLFVSSDSIGSVGNLVVNSLGKVGIGTNTPSAQLDIVHGVTGSNIGLRVTSHRDIPSGILAGGKFSVTGSADWLYGIQSSVNGTGTIGTAAFVAQNSSSSTYNHGVYSSASGTGINNYAFIGSATGATTNWAGYFMDGNVYVQNKIGIGTLAPTAKLDIVDSTDNSWAMQVAQKGSSSSRGLLVNLSSSADGKVFEAAKDSTAYFVVANNGNVGIGTTSPTTGKFVVKNTNGNGYVVLDGFQEVPDDFHRTMSLNVDTNGGNIETYGAGYKNLLLNPRGGNVGIGTTNPLNILHVSSSSAGQIATFRNSNGNYGIHIMVNDASDYLGYGLAGLNAIRVASGEHFGIVTGGSPTPRLIVRETGNVGIGTTSPSALLQVGGGGIFAGNQIWANAANTLQGQVTFDSGNNYLIFGGITTGTSLQFLAGNSVMVHINGANGKVGIGTTSPSERLTIEGAVKAGQGVMEGSVIAVARSHAAYMVIVSNNYNTGNNVRSAIYQVLLNNEGTDVAYQTSVSTLNGQTATFSVSGGNLIISGLPAGNNNVAVFGN